jgi:hypothetical protein
VVVRLPEGPTRRATFEKVESRFDLFEILVSAGSLGIAGARAQSEVLISVRVPIVCNPLAQIELDAIDHSLRVVVIARRYGQ